MEDKNLTADNGSAPNFITQNPEIIDSIPSDSQINFKCEKTNFWNNSFAAPEMSCDFQLLQDDLHQIKLITAEIKDCIKEYLNCK